VGIDVAQTRLDTPGCAAVTHFNNAGAALPPSVVTETVVEHLRLEATIGGYEAHDRALDRLEHTYDAVASLIGAHPDEIALTESATRSWAAAFYSLPFGPGDRILTARAEYASNVIAYLQVAARTGARVEVVDDDGDGQLSVDDLRRRIDDDVKLIAVTHVPTQGGLVNPAAEVGALAQAAGIPFLLDACQSVGQLRLDVNELGCDILSATGRKYLRAPRGTGFLYVRRALLESIEPATLDLHSATWVAPDRFEVRGDARRFEQWEASYAARLGLGAAVDYALALGGEAIEARVVALGAELRAALAELPGARVHDQGRRRCGIVTFTRDGIPPEEISRRLRTSGINTSVSSVTSAQYDFPRRGLRDVVRASVHYYNTSEEISRVVAAVAALEP
jgi:cysteine desulfurase / selenocysteine lyase